MCSSVVLWVVGGLVQCHAVVLCIVCACKLYLFDAKAFDEEDASFSEQCLVGCCLINTMHRVVLCGLHNDSCMNRDGSLSHCIKPSIMCV